METIKFIKTNDRKLTVFTSALHKQMFLDTHKKGTYTILGNGNAVAENLYILVDTEGTGFVLNKSGITYNECEELIRHYL